MLIKNKNKVLLIPAILFILVIAFICVLNQKPKPVYMNASWTYSYGSIEDLTKSSDIIAVVKIIGKAAEYKNDNIPFTDYNAQIVEPVYNIDKNQEIIITMTGWRNSKEHIEISDDPLMNTKDEFLIFANKNAEGTYTILGGPQGRFVYDEGKISSLYNVNERLKEQYKTVPRKYLNYIDTDATKIFNEIQKYLVN